MKVEPWPNNYGIENGVLLGMSQGTHREHTKKKKKKPFFLELTVGKNDVVVGDMRGHV
jgi:hypothetical protein